MKAHHSRSHLPTSWVNSHRLLINTHKLRHCFHLLPAQHTGTELSPPEVQKRLHPASTQFRSTAIYALHKIPIQHWLELVIKLTREKNFWKTPRSLQTCSGDGNDPLASLLVPLLTLMNTLRSFWMRIKMEIFSPHHSLNQNLYSHSQKPHSLIILLLNSTPASFCSLYLVGASDTHRAHRNRLPRRLHRWWVQVHGMLLHSHVILLHSTRESMQKHLR